VEGSTTSETKEETAQKVSAGDAEASATSDNLPALTKRRIFLVCILLCVMMWTTWLMVVGLDRLVLYEGITWDERSYEGAAGTAGK
jgi:hypothetical protein